MKPNRFFTIAVWMFALSLPACESVIQVDVDAAAARLVIEAEVIDGPGPHHVHLSRSVGIDASSIFPEVSGAFVMIADNAGAADTLREVSPGHYETTGLVGTPGSTYRLTVIDGEQTFSATSTMPQPVLLDSVFNFNAVAFGTTRYPVVALLSDPAGVRNQYRFIAQVSGNRVGGSIVEDDEVFEGQNAQVFLPGLGADVALGDTLVLRMQSIDPLVFKYFDSFGSSDGGPGGSSAPANPYTNIVGGAMGYFNACAVSSKTIVIR